MLRSLGRSVFTRAVGLQGDCGVADAMGFAHPGPRHRDEMGGQDEGTGEV